MEIISTIIPIFAVILLGWGVRRRGFIADEFLDPANRLVYNLSIPALIFSAIAKTSFHQQFAVRVVVLAVLAMFLVYCLSLLISRLTHMETERAGAFILSSSHSNIGYIGLPTAYYYLGEEGFATAGIICGFVMIAQNLFSVIFLQMQQVSFARLSSWKRVLKPLALNPVILGAVGGMIVSICGVKLPVVVWRTVEILGGLAPPMALLLIGASLSLKLVGDSLLQTIGAIGMKLFVLPAVAILLFWLFRVEHADFLPAVILLCSPPATVVYVMVKGMRRDADFAVTQISLGTLVSALTFIFWLTLIPRLFT